MADQTGLPLDPRLQADLLDSYNMSINRTARTEPIHQAAMAMAQHMAPDYAQAAMGAPPGRTDPASIAGALSTGGNGSGSSGATAAGIAALLAALAKGGGSGASGELGKLAKWLANLFKGHQFQGNKPFSGGIGPVTNPYGGFQGWGPNPNDNGMNYDQWPGGDPFGPTPNVDTNEWMGQWPETPTPFAPFDPTQIGGGSTGRPDDPYGNP